MVKPKVDLARCLDTRYPQLVCGSCVTACPRDALEVSPDQVTIADTCDGCGLCAPACSEAALTFSPAREWFVIDDEAVGLAACERSASSATRVCVHALGVRELLDGIAAGVHRWQLATGDCGTCRRAPRLEASVTVAASRVDAVLRARAARGLTVGLVDSRAWDEARRRARPLADPLADGEARRTFLRRLLRPAPAPAAPQLPPPIAPGQRVPRRAGALAFFAISIDPAACTACHACARLCPTDALVLETDAAGASLRYSLHSDACTGCGVCEASCDDSAITVAVDEPASDTPVPLRAARCATCAEVHTQVDTPTPRCRRRRSPPRLLVL
ncbi:MAG: 4Fe-4S binding protein [Myxococcales bacterium]|nr:4Fe-4S binding protein [Myxococcales bacterium]